ncbi:S-layer homology domain-containing protein [Cohnella soli]|uniref:S-layer homology domain-containing protein n=1 Tax=Cohnella soli TaxID=425005 RepID=A0ABW0I2H9_9BACL
MKHSLRKRISLFVLHVLTAVLFIGAAAPPASAQSYSPVLVDNDMGGWVNASNSGTVTVSGGNLNVTAANQDLHVYDKDSLNLADGSVSFRMKPGEGMTGAMFRYASENSYIWVGYEYSLAGVGHWRIREAAYTQPDVFFTTSALDANTNYQVKVQYIGKELTVWLDGKEVYSDTLQGWTTLGAGKIGFVVWGNGSAAFSQIVQEDIPPPAARWVSASGTGTLTEANGRLNVIAADQEVHVTDSQLPSAKDGVYSFRMQPGTGTAGGLIRYTSESSYIWIGYEYSFNGVGHWRIREAAYAQPDVFFTSPALDPNTWYDVKIRYAGKRITVWINDSQVYSGTLDSLITTGPGKEGFVIWSVGNANFEQAEFEEILEPDPSSSYEISNGSLSVLLDKKFPQPLQYKLNESGAVLYGASTEDSPAININGMDYMASVTDLTYGSDYMNYTVSVPDFNVQIGYRFTLEGQALVRTITDISGPGEPNVQTVRITSPILKVKEKQAGNGAAWYADALTDRIGGLSTLGTSNQQTPWAFVYTSGAVGAVYNNLPITPFKMVVAKEAGQKYAAIYDNAYPYRFKTVKPGVWFESKTYIGGDANANGTVDWQDGAIWVRDQLPPMPTDLKDFFRNGGNWSQTHMAFPRSDNPIPESTMLMTQYSVLAAQQRKLFYQTDGLSRQSYEAVGWQYRGHDWNYPDWANQQLNPGLGERSDLDWARNEIMKYNGDLSFHVNADDMSELSNAYQTIPDILAKDVAGTPKFSHNAFGYNVWYISHFKDLLKGTALPRIDDFVAKYWAPRIVYQDVMLPHTSEDVGYGIDEEWYAMKREVDQWRSHGTYTATEFYSPEKRRNGGFLFKRYATSSIIDRFINAGVTFMQYNYFPWESPAGYVGEEYDKLFGNVISGRDRMGNLNGVDNMLADALVKDHYLINLVNATMGKYTVQEYVNDAGKYQVRWGNNLIARFDKTTRQFTLTQGNVVMAKGYDRFLPSPDGNKKIYAYSRDGRAITWTLPGSWSDVADVDLYELTDSGRAFVDRIAVVNGTVTYTFGKATPYVLLPGGSGDYKPGAVNQAPGQSVTASSFSGTEIAANAVDGNFNTKWTPTGQESWLEIDFGRETTVNRAVLSEVGNHIGSYAIEYWNGEAWQGAYSGSAVGAQATNVFPEFRSSKVRLHILSASLAPSIAEFRLYADRNLALAAKASASSNDNNDFSYSSYLVGEAAGDFTYRFDVQASRAMDGATESYWSAIRETNGAWLQAEFKDIVKIDRVVLSEEGNNVSSFQLQKWDGKSWSTVHEGTTIGSLREIEMRKFSATKIRLLIAASAAEPKIREFKIYEKGNALAASPMWSPDSRLSVRDVGTTSLRLDWTPANEECTTGYRVYKGNELLASLSGDLTTYVVSGLNPGTGYAFKVEALDMTGHWSQDGPGITVTTQSIVVPSTPGGSLPVQSSDSGDLYAVSEGELSGTTGGKVTLQLPKGKSGIQLPIRAASILGASELVVQAEGVTVTIPSDTLSAVATLAGSGLTSAGRIVFSIGKESNPSAESMVLPGAGPNASLKAGGEIYRLKLAVVGEDGKEQELTSFPQPVEVEFSFDGSVVNKDLAGVYWFDEKNAAWEYVGGLPSSSQDVIAVQLSHFSAYAVLQYKKEFDDVPARHWAHHALEILTARHIVKGATDQAFNPQGQTTRAEAVALLTRLLGLKASGQPAFRDIAASAWYADAVSAASEAGLIKGVTDSEFQPDAKLTREQLASLLVHAYQYKKGSTEGIGKLDISFADQEKISSWAAEDVRTAVGLGLMVGTGGNRFNAASTATRAEIAQAVYRLLQML